MLKLRPHHLNCLFFYEGKGYSETFVAQMTQVVDYLKANQLEQVKLVRAADTICASCPHLKNSQCASAQKVDELDEMTLRTYGLESNEVYTFQELRHKIYAQFSPSDFEAICRSCEWYKQGVCSREKIERQKKIWNA